MPAVKFVYIILFFNLLVSCNRSDQYKSDLNKNNHPTVICKAAYKLGEAKDISAIKPLLNNILDVRMSTNIRFKGMTVCYCKLGALEKITGIKPPFKADQFEIDTFIVNYYVDTLIKKGVISAGEVDINY
ncbi:hypothetical protein [Ferruginibacter sp.]|nr:hypothetical protein [Ferruginibacter sp.]